jgi:hypothetical protein
MPRTPRELSMTENKPSPSAPMNGRGAAYEARLRRLERELPSFEHELRRVEAKSSATSGYRELPR